MGIEGGGWFVGEGLWLLVCGGWLLVCGYWFMVDGFLMMTVAVGMGGSPSRLSEVSLAF